jgi:hypothetical protein
MSRSFGGAAMPSAFAVPRRLVLCGKRQGAWRSHPANLSAETRSQALPAAAHVRQAASLRRREGLWTRAASFDSPEATPTISRIQRQRNNADRVVRRLCGSLLRMNRLSGHGAILTKRRSRLIYPIDRHFRRMSAYLKGAMSAKWPEDIRPFHPITLSARARSVGLRSRALAVWRLITSSNFISCWTGNSEG